MSQQSVYGQYIQSLVDHTIDRDASSCIDVELIPRGVLFVQQRRNRTQLDDFFDRVVKIVNGRIDTIGYPDDSLIFPKHYLVDEVNAFTNNDLVKGLFDDKTIFNVKVCFSFSSSFAFVYLSYNFGGDNCATVLIHEFKFIRG